MLAGEDVDGSHCNDEDDPPLGLRILEYLIVVAVWCTGDGDVDMYVE